VRFFEAYRLHRFLVIVEVRNHAVEHVERIDGPGCQRIVVVSQYRNLYQATAHARFGPAEVIGGLIKLVRTGVKLARSRVFAAYCVFVLSAAMVSGL
jgi:hypothetical protein